MRRTRADGATIRLITKPPSFHNRVARAEPSPVMIAGTTLKTELIPLLPGLERIPLGEGILSQKSRYHRIMRFLAVGIASPEVE